MTDQPPSDLVPISAPPKDLIAVGGASAPKPKTQAELDAEKVTAHEDPAQRATMQGATLGWAKELTADEYAATVAAENAYRKATGKPVPYGIGEARHAMLGAETESEADFHKKHPYIDEALGLGGGALTPGVGKAAKWVGEGANWASKGLRSALAGGATGAVAGASEDKDRLGSAEGGAIGGTVFGGSLHMLGSAVRAGLPTLAKRMGSGLAESWQQITKMFGADDPAVTPQQRAEAQKKALEYVHNVAEAAKKTPADIAANPEAAAGKPVTGAEAIGRPGITQLSAVGKRIGETPNNLESMLRQRQQDRPARITADLQSLTGVPAEAIEGDFEKQLVGLRQKASPFYDAAYAEKVDNPQLRALLRRPSVIKALNNARSIAAEEGRNPDDIGLTLKPRENFAIGAHQPIIDEVEVKNPSMQTWDYVKRGLDDVLEESRNKVTKKLDLDDKGRATLETLNELRDQLFKSSKAYEHAVSLGGEAPRQADAYHSAPNLAANTMSEGVFDKRIAKYTPAQMEALRGGYIADVYNRTRTGRLRLKDMETPAFVYKAEKILGKDQAAKFLQNMKMEQKLAANENRMMPGTGSQTMDMGAADRERDDATGFAADLAKRAVKQDWLGAVGKVLGGGAAGITAPIDQATRDEVGRLLMLPPGQLAAEMVKVTPKAKTLFDKITANPAAQDAARRALMSEISHQAQ